MSTSNEQQHRRHIMEELKQACIDGDLIEVRKYMCVVKQPAFPFKELEKALKPLVYWAAKAGRLDVLKELIERYKCDPRYTTERGHTLLYVASARGHAGVARYLATKHGVDPNQKNNQQSTPLFAACNNGYLEVMTMLIDELKCDPKATNYKGESLLHRACGGGHLELVKCLITKYNLSPTACSDVNDTPLHDACASGHLVVVQYLIEEHKCKTTIFNNSLSTPLHIVCRNGHTEGHTDVVQYLVMKQNCDTALYDNSGSLPLHLACRFRRKDVVRVLLDSGKVNPNLPTLRGELPIEMAQDPDIIKYLIRSGAKPPVGRVPQILRQFVKQAPLDSLVHIFMIGHSEAGKSTLAQALQMPVTTSLGGLITRASTVASDIPRTAGIIPMEFNSPDFGRVLLYDFAGHPEFHASHGALLEHFNTSTAPLFLLVVDLNDNWDDVKRKTDYWLSFVETHRLPGVSPPRVLIIGSHQDELKKKNPEGCQGIISALDSHTRKRLKRSRLCHDGFFAIDCREPKRHRELRQCLKKSCDALRFNHGIDSCCHVLFVFLTQEFNSKLSCTIEDIIEKAKRSESFPIPIQASRLCDLAEDLSTRTKILFLRNKEQPEKSWIVLDIDMLLKKINGRIFAPQGLPEHCLTPTHTGVLPWSQIERHLPDLDPSLVVSFLGRLEFCQVVKDREVLSLITGTDSGDEETDSPTSSHRRSLCSQTSTCTTSSAVSSTSNQTSGSSVFSEKDGLPPNWKETLFSANAGAAPTRPCGSNHTFPQQQLPAIHDHHNQPSLPLPLPLPLPSPSSPPSTETPPPLPQLQFNPSVNRHQQQSSFPNHHTATGIITQHSGSPPHVTQAEQHQYQNGAPRILQHNNHVPPSSGSPLSQHHHSNVSSPTIITPGTVTAAQSPQAFSPPSAPTEGLLSPFGTKPSICPLPGGSSSLPNPSPLGDRRKRQATSPPRLSSRTSSSNMHDELHRMSAGGSQPSLPEEQTWPLTRPPIHKSTSETTLTSSQHEQYQCTCRTQARSQGGSPRMSRNMGCVQSPAQGNDKFLFFPGLVNSGQPSGEMWLRDESFVFYSGWCLQSAQSHKFFTPRFLQTLILRLAFGFAVSRPPNGGLTSSMSLFSRECTIWKNGLRWLNLDGVETFVEMVEDGNALLLLMRAKRGSELRGVSLRSALIQKILATKEECCPSMPTAEYMIHPKHLRERESYPIITHRVKELTRYDVNLIARAIVAENRRQPCQYVMDTHNRNMEQLTDILYFDPYMRLRSDTLQKIFDEGRLEEDLTEELLLDFSYDYQEYSDCFQEILLEGYHRQPPPTPDSNLCFVVLKRYWEKTKLKIKDFRQDLDRHSIFCGRNLLELVYY